MNMDTGQIQSLRFADLVALLIALCFEVARRLEIPIPQAAASSGDTESVWEQVDPEVGPQKVHPAVGQQQGYGAVGQQQVDPAVGSGQQGHPAGKWTTRPSCSGPTTTTSQLFLSILRRFLHTSRALAQAS